jgi:Tol biopolymer transport system component
LFSEESTPEISDDGLTLYYTSSLGFDGLDLYVATRASLTMHFTTGTKITELSTQEADADPWVSSDGRVIYFTSNRGNGARIYHASR